MQVARMNNLPSSRDSDDLTGKAGPLLTSLARARHSIFPDLMIGKVAVILGYSGQERVKGRSCSCGAEQDRRSIDSITSPSISCLDTVKYIPFVKYILYIQTAQVF